MIEFIIANVFLTVFAITDLGNKNPSWEFIGNKECQSGQKPSGHAYSIGGKVFLKQRNHDGSIGPVCQ